MRSQRSPATKGASTTLITRAPELKGVPAKQVQSSAAVPDGASLDLKTARSYDDPAYLDKKEAAAILGLNPKTIERAILRGELRAYKPAGKVRIRRADLDAWVEANVVNPSIHDI